MRRTPSWIPAAGVTGDGGVPVRADARKKESLADVTTEVRVIDTTRTIPDGKPVNHVAATRNPERSDVATIPRTVGALEGAATAGVETKVTWRIDTGGKSHVLPR